MCMPLLFVEALKDSYWEVRSSAAESRADWRCTGYPDLQALKDRYWMVSSSAAEALGQIGDARATRILSSFKG